MPTGEKGKSYKENMEYHRGTSWKAKLRVAVDKAIWTSINYEEFLQKMQLAGYEVRQGKHLSFRAPEQKDFTYMKSLGSYYSEENIRIRLAKNRSCIFRKNCASVPEERSAIPLQTEQSSAG